MRKSSYIFGYIFILALMSLALVPDEAVLADAWWGYGYRTPDWVLGHGGTIIYYEVENISGDGDEYKAVMYDEDGDYVEKEFGKKGVFDDAKDGVYKIRAYRGGTEDKLTYKGGKKFASITVTAHPGETMTVEFNYKKKKVKMTTDYVQPAPKPVAKVVPAPAPAPVPEPASESQPEPAPETFDSASIQEDESSTAMKSDEPLVGRAEELFHPDAFAGGLGKQTLIKQGNFASQEVVEKKEQENIFVKIWNAVAKLFGFRR